MAISSVPTASIVSRNPSLSHTAALVEIIPHHHEYTILKTNQSRKKCIYPRLKTVQINPLFTLVLEKSAKDYSVLRFLSQASSSIKLMTVLLVLVFS